MTENAHLRVVTSPSSTAIPNLVEPGLAERYGKNIPGMTVSLLKLHYTEYDRMLRGEMPFSPNDRAEIEAIMRMIAERLDELVPTVSMILSDGDKPVNSKVAENWPEGATHSSLLMHAHYCELVFAWNLNPFRRDTSTVTVDAFAETIAISRFAFCSSESLDDFLEFYGLDDLVLVMLEPGTLQNPSDFWSLRLENSFDPKAFNAFYDVYKSAMDHLAAIHVEHVGAIRNDSGKIYYPCADHFAMRETHELMRIRKAREDLGAGHLESNKSK